MFIRWIERPSKTPGYDATALSLILAESKRVDGKPKQRHLAYLGGITDEQIAHAGSRCYFWDSVTAAFDKNANRVTPADRRRFEAAIARRVPRPSAEERAAVVEERVKERVTREAVLADVLMDVAMWRLCGRGKPLA